MLGQNLAVDHLNLEAREGEILGILGPNGAGKSTTLLMLLIIKSSSQNGEYETWIWKGKS
jgi:ABC-2 type transport system ATP-binding protein